MDGICVGLISIVILLINTLPFVVSQRPGFISIDCGATENHVDNVTGIQWTNDNMYSNIGESNTIPGGHIFFPDTELLTARRFPEYKKNCYEIPTTNNTKYLLRIRFLYANYYVTGPDHTMYLIMDDAIINRIEPWGTGTYEFIITAVSNVTSVCFGRDNEDPFVNSIELRPLDHNMYRLATRATILSIEHQYAVVSGYDIDIIRSPNDTYDRFWVPRPFPDLERIKGINTSATRTCAEKTEDKVPADLMSTGVQSGCSIELSDDIEGYEIALTFFFPEFDNQEDRVIDIELEYDTLNGDLVAYNNLSVSLSGVCNFTIKSDNDFGLINTAYNFTIQSVNPGCPTPDLAPAPRNRSISPYAPLNAWHASSPRYRPQKGTNKTEFDVMRSIKEHFNITKWTGDPCLPVNFTWDKVECDYDGPNVTVKSVNLSEMNLTNTVPKLFTQLTSLQTLDLSNNNLHGELPDILFKNHLLKVYYSNNPKLHRKGLTKIQRNIIISIVVIVVIIALFVGFLVCRHIRGKTLEEYTKDAAETQGGESTETSKWRVPWSSPIMEKDPTQT